MYSAVVALNSIYKGWCAGLRLPTPVWKHARRSYLESFFFKNPRNDMFTTTDLDEQCLRIWMFEAKQSHWQEGGNAVRWKHSGGRWVSVEDCAGRAIRSLTSHQILWTATSAVWDVRSKSDTCAPPLKTHLRLQEKGRKNCLGLKTIVRMCKEAGP